MLDYQINELISKAYGKIYHKPISSHINEDDNGDNQETQFNNYNDDEDVVIDKHPFEYGGNSQNATDNTTNTAQTKVSSNQEALERAKGQNFDTGAISNVFSKDTLKEGLKGGARAVVDTGTSIAKMGTGVARVLGQNELADSIDKRLDDTAYSIKHNELGSDYGDDVTNLSDVGGKVAGEAFSMAIPAGALGKLGKTMNGVRGAATGTKALTQGLKAYGAHRFAHQMADVSDNLGLPDKYGNAIRLGGDLYAASRMLKNPQSAGSLINKIAWGVPGGVGLTYAVDDVADELNDKGLISDKTKDKIVNAGDVVSFGGIGAPLWNIGMDAVNNYIKKRLPKQQISTDTADNEKDEPVDNDYLIKQLSEIDYDNLDDNDIDASSVEQNADGDGDELVDNDYLINQLLNIDDEE